MDEEQKKRMSDFVSDLAELVDKFLKSRVDAEMRFAVMLYEDQAVMQSGVCLSNGQKEDLIDALRVIIKGLEQDEEIPIHQVPSWRIQ